MEQLLKLLGLSEKESRVYEALLKIGQGPAAAIIKASGLKRGITYSVLDSLAKTGLIKKFNKEGKAWFQPEPPQKLQELAEAKIKEAQLAKAQVEEILPKLSSQYRLALGKPTIRYFEGKQGLVEVFEDIYAPKKEPVYGAVDVDKIESVFEGWSIGKLIPSRLKTGLKVKVLFNDTQIAKKLHARDKKEKRTSILLDQKKYPLPAEIEAYENKIALMSFKKGDFLGLIIENEDFAITLRSVFKFLFDQSVRPQK